MRDDLRSLAAQTIMCGFRGLHAGDGDPVLQNVRAGVGSVVLFDVDGPSGGAMARNVASPSQVAGLCASLTAASPQPALLIAVDMEGGLVCRLGEDHGFAPVPSARELGRTGDPQRTCEAAAGIAATLCATGVNFNLAPCVDVDVNPDNPIIGSKHRSYAADPEAVAEHAAAFIRAHRDRGILTCLKHFPGHGSSRDDTHAGFTDVTATWSQQELLPYRRLIDQGLVDAVMTAHVVHHGFDDCPATLSPRLIDRLLRDELGFDGVVVSDDMGMGAISKQYGFGESILRALDAGVDLLTLANQASYEEEIVARTIDIVTAAVAGGHLRLERLEDAARRVTRLQQRLATIPPTPARKELSDGTA